MLFERNIAAKIFCPYFLSYRNFTLIFCPNFLLVAGKTSESSCSCLSQRRTVLPFQDFVNQDRTTATGSRALMCHFGAKLAVI